MTIYRTFLHLSDDQWGNEVMAQVADAFANAHADKRPLIVEVYEHAGWFLNFLYGAPGLTDGTICGTANDLAVLPKQVLEFGKSIDGEIFIRRS
jgi:hypothetical protein